MPARRGSAAALRVLAAPAAELPALVAALAAHFAHDLLGHDVLAALRAEWRALAARGLLALAPDSDAAAAAALSDNSDSDSSRAVLPLAEGAREVSVVADAGSGGSGGSTLRVAVLGGSRQPRTLGCPLALVAPAVPPPGALVALARVLAAPWAAASDVLAVCTTYATSTRCRLLLADPAAPAHSAVAPLRERGLDEHGLALVLQLPPRADRPAALAVPVVYAFAEPCSVRFADAAALAPAARALVARVAKLPGAAARADSLKTLVEWLLAVV